MKTCIDVFAVFIILVLLSAATAVSRSPSYEIQLHNRMVKNGKGLYLYTADSQSSYLVRP